MCVSGAVVRLAGKRVFKDKTIKTCQKLILSELRKVGEEAREPVAANRVAVTLTSPSSGSPLLGPDLNPNIFLITDL